MSVYNDYDSIGLHGTAVRNRAEHAEVRKLVWKADTTSMSNPEYDSILEQAFVTFDTHAREEEDDQ